jgi:hypothetical protein
MNSPSRVILLLALAGSAGACGEGRADLPVLVLAPAGDSIFVPFTIVTQATWLGNERWAVLAPDEDLVALIDFADGSVDTLGGRRHSVYHNPLTLFAANDTLYVSDWGLRRVTLWDQSGRLLDSFPAFADLRGALPQAGDGAGQFYIKLPPRGRAGIHDSAAVVRTTPDRQSGDTVAKLAPLDIVEIQGDRGVRFERRIMSGEDAWGVRVDGAGWVARVGQNRVTWFTPDGRNRDGPLLPDRLLPVTQIDRDQFLQEFPPALRSTARRLPFAAIKPAFVAGFTAADGEVWLERSRAPADTTQQYQVIDSTGQLVAAVHIPGWGRLRAVSMGAALVAEPSDGRTLLLEFEVPIPAPEATAD